MEDFIINVGKVEEMQMIKDVQALDEIFQRAKKNPGRRGDGCSCAGAKVRGVLEGWGADQPGGL